MMSCTDVAGLLEPFVDSELTPATLLDVARHAGHCASCEAQVADLLAVREAVVAGSERAIAGLDLSAVWPHVAREMERIDAQTAWRARSEGRRVSRRLVVWGSVAAIAAGAMLMMRGPLLPTGAPVAGDGAPAAPTRVAKRLPNSVYIDRLAGKDIALRREPKSGTTMIWVHHEVQNR